jgi:hypothetical protein
MFGILVALVVLFASAKEADAFFYSWGGESFHVIERDFFQDEDGTNHLAVIFQQTSIMFVPLWNYNKRFCWVTDESLKNGGFWIIDEPGQIELRERGYNLDIGFWNAIGGKLLLLLLVGGYFILPKNKKDDKGGDKNELPVDA